jgi:starch synthase
MKTPGKLNVCYVTSECVPFVKTGGLADVSGALPYALSGLNCHIKIFIPFYKSINAFEFKLDEVKEVHKVPVILNDKTYYFRLWYGKLYDSLAEVYFIDCPEFFDRDSVYTNDKDEDLRFILFQNAVLISLRKINWFPDVIHCNDWQTSLIPYYLKTRFYSNNPYSNISTLLTIHNIAYQGIFPKENVLNANIRMEDFMPFSPFEYYEQFCFLKTGIHYSDFLNTVSPTYAEETKTSEIGSGLQDFLDKRSDEYTGILNGIDTNIWNPISDNLIPSNYDFRTIGKKFKNKIELLELVNLPYDENKIVIGLISRFAWQKGIELIMPIIDELMKLNLQLIVLGTGDEMYQKFFRDAQSNYPDKISVDIGYNNELAHLITAGSDMFLMPSRYEPCGLNQMYSLNYGTIPIVRKTGGLADTVKDYNENSSEGNGFSFIEFTPEKLLETVKRSLTVFSDKEKRMKIIQKGMSEDFSWSNSAEKYFNLYKMLAKEKTV